MGNQFNLMIKTTSLASVISMEELFRRTQQLSPDRIQGSGGILMCRLLVSVNDNHLG